MKGQRYSANSFHYLACVLWGPLRLSTASTRLPEDDHEDLELFSLKSLGTWKKSEPIMCSRNRMRTDLMEFDRNKSEPMFWRNSVRAVLKRPRTLQNIDPMHRTTFCHMAASLMIKFAQLQGLWSWLTDGLPRRGTCRGDEDLNEQDSVWSESNLEKKTLGQGQDNC